MNGQLAAPLPEEVSSRSVKRGAIRLGGLLVVAVLAIKLIPGLGNPRGFSHASFGWIAAALSLELLLTLSYVLALRVVFCTRMRWGTNTKIDLSDEGANSAPRRRRRRARTRGVGASPRWDA